MLAPSEFKNFLQSLESFSSVKKTENPLKYIIEPEQNGPSGVTIDIVFNESGANMVIEANHLNDNGFTEGDSASRTFELSDLGWYKINNEEKIQLTDEEIESLQKTIKTYAESYAANLSPIPNTKEV